jgi:hypothetical protein
LDSHLPTKIKNFFKLTPWKAAMSIHSHHQNSSNFFYEHQLPLPDAPAMVANVKNYVLQSGVMYNGKPGNIVLVHPDNASVAHALSNIAVENDRRNGVENVKPRDYPEVQVMTRIDTRLPTAKGGLLVAYEQGDKMYAMGGQALISDPGDGGRGEEFSLCPLGEQTYMKMAITHPNYKGGGLSTAIFAWRIKIAIALSKKFKRTHIVAKAVENTSTAKFYENKKDGGMGFVKDGGIHIIPNIPAPHNRLATFGKNVAGVEEWLVKNHPTVAESDFDLDTLNDAYKLNKPQLQVV